MQSHTKTNAKLLATPAKRACCSMVEQLCLNRRLFVEKERPLVGWKISQVEKLVGLPRRDVQRACYDGKGGAGILAPKDGGWGRRTYTKEDLATLFLVSEMKREGPSLPEAKREFERSAAGKPQTASLLESREWRLAEKLEEVEARMLRTQALRLALAEADVRKIAWLAWRAVEKSLADRLDSLPQPRAQLAHMFFDACESIVRRANDKEGRSAGGKANGERSNLENGGGKSAAERMRALFAAMETPEWPASHAQHDFARALETPGLDLAIELWLGPGSFDIVQSAFEEYGRPTEAEEEASIRHAAKNEAKETPKTFE